MDRLDVKKILEVKVSTVWLFIKRLFDLFNVFQTVIFSLFVL